MSDHSRLRNGRVIDIVMMKLLAAFARLTLTVVLGSMMGGCAFSPGMSFSGSPVDATDPASRPVVTPITFALIQQEKAAATAQLMRDRADAPLIGKPAPYLIGKHDVLSIVVWDHPELVLPNLTYDVGTGMAGAGGMATQTIPGFVVDQSGDVQFPYVRRLSVVGKSEQQVQRELTTMLEPYVTDPQVTVRVVGFRSQKAYVDGEVRSPGVKPLTDVPSTLAEILNQAGGIASTGDPSNITLTRNGVNYHIDVPKLHLRNLDLNDIIVKSGDSIRVAPILEHHVIVIGEVGRQMPVPFRTDGSLSLGDALGDAGGVNQVSGDASEIYVIRRGPMDAAPIAYHLDARSPTAMSLASSFQLHSDDVVYVGTAAVVRWDRFITPLVGSALVGTATSAYYLHQTARGD